MSGLIKKQDVVVVGGLVVGAVVLIYVAKKGISDLLGFGFDWKQYGIKYKEYAEALETNLTTEKVAYGDLYNWYEGSIDTINELNKKIADLTNEALMNPPKLVVHPGVTALGSNLKVMLDRSEDATKKINDAVKSGVNVADTVSKEIKKVIASKAPGWMPRGEV